MRGVNNSKCIHLSNDTIHEKKQFHENFPSPPLRFHSSKILNQPIWNISRIKFKMNFFTVESFNFIQINGFHQKYNIIKSDNSNCECLIQIIISMHPRSGVHGPEIFRNLDKDLPSKTSRMVHAEYLTWNFRSASLLFPV